MKILELYKNPAKTQFWEKKRQKTKKKKNKQTNKQTKQTNKTVFKHFCYFNSSY